MEDDSMKRSNRRRGGDEEMKRNEAQRSAGDAVSDPYRVRLPEFILEQEIGLGDVVKKATSIIGIRPCGGCEGRAAALNRRFVFSGR
jgi:hypothetical protein